MLLSQPLRWSKLADTAGHRLRAPAAQTMSSSIGSVRILSSKIHSAAILTNLHLLFCFVASQVTLDNITYVRVLLEAGHCILAAAMRLGYGCPRQRCVCAEAGHFLFMLTLCLAFAFVVWNYLQWHIMISFFVCLDVVAASFVC